MGDSVAFDDLKDQRTLSPDTYSPPHSTGGLGGYWPGFTISWDITYDLTIMVWTYEYTLSATRKDISHFILEMTEGTTKDDFITLSINGKPSTFGNEIEGSKFWGEHPSNPGFPPNKNIYGIKFDVGGNPVKYAFTTPKDHDPVWGNFYSKSGKDRGEWVFAHTNALASGESDNPLDFIARPDGGNNPPIVPEPISSLLFITGGAFFGGKAFHAKKAHFISCLLIFL